MYLDQSKDGINWNSLVKGFGDSFVQHYYNFMVGSAELMGAPKDRARKEMERALQFEIDLAKISESPLERRDERKRYNEKTIGDLEGQPGYPPSVKDYINKIFAYAGVSGKNVTKKDKIIVRNLGYAKKLDNLLKNTSNRDIANFIHWRVFRQFIPFLDSPARSLKEEYEWNILVFID